MAQKEKSGARGKTCFKSTGFCSFGDASSASAIDVKGGKIIRTRPLHYDWKYKPEEFKPGRLRHAEKYSHRL